MRCMDSMNNIFDLLSVKMCELAIRVHHHSIRCIRDELFIFVPSVIGLYISSIYMSASYEELRKSDKK